MCVHLFLFFSYNAMYTKTSTWPKTRPELYIKSDEENWPPLSIALCHPLLPFHSRILSFSLTLAQTIESWAKICSRMCVCMCLFVCIRVYTCVRVYIYSSEILIYRLRSPRLRIEHGGKKKYVKINGVETERMENYEVRFARNRLFVTTPYSR